MPHRIKRASGTSLAPNGHAVPPGTKQEPKTNHRAGWALPGALNFWFFCFKTKEQSNHQQHAAKK